ncbi:hypothetical protein CPC08DRAFT_712325 [Agrocybe pediades]|nr:hypothetical protein CPC08DRAFT_712325 [Agrocybe pediades]
MEDGRWSLHAVWWSNLCFAMVGGVLIGVPYYCLYAVVGFGYWGIPEIRGLEWA